MLLPKPWSLGPLVILILGLDPHTRMAVTEPMADNSFRGAYASFGYPGHDKSLSGSKDMLGHFLLNVCQWAFIAQSFIQDGAEPFSGFFEDRVFHFNLCVAGWSGFHPISLQISWAEPDPTPHISRTIAQRGTCNFRCRLTMWMAFDSMCIRTT